MDALATFCCSADKLFGDVKQTFCLLYSDDFFTYTKTFGDYLKHQKVVHARHQTANLKIKLTKCSCAAFQAATFPQQEFTLKSKNISCKDYARPHNLQALWGWLGLTNYFRRFIQDYLPVAEPLTRLTAKDCPYIWTNGQQRSLDESKWCLASS